MNLLERFLEQVEARTIENQKSFELLYENECFGVCIGIIRQEIDTLLRVSYLIDWSKGYKLRENAYDLIKSSVELGEWKYQNNHKKMVQIRDREMLLEGGWEEVVYKFGCGLIHLSNKHLYKTSDPIVNLSDQEKEKIIHYLSYYHNYEKIDLNMLDIIEYLPKIYEKIYSNIEGYIEEIIEISKQDDIVN